MQSYGEQTWAVGLCIATGTGSTTIKAAPGAGKTLMVRRLSVELVTAAAQAFDIEDTAGTVELVKEPASRAVGQYIFDYGDIGVALTVNNGLVYTATAGVQLNIAVHGYVISTQTSS